MLVRRKMVLTKIFATTGNQTTRPLSAKTAVAFSINSFAFQRSVIGIPPDTMGIHAQTIINQDIISSSIAKTAN